MNAEDLVIGEEIQYCAKTLEITHPLKIYNPTLQSFAFKIKTNARNCLSMDTTQDIIKPKLNFSVNFKLVEQPPPNSEIKLQINYGAISPEALKVKGASLTSCSPGDMRIKIVTFKATFEEQMEESKTEKDSSLVDFTTMRSIDETTPKVQRVISPRPTKITSPHLAQQQLLTLRKLIQEEKEQIIAIQEQKEANYRKNSAVHAEMGRICGALFVSYLIGAMCNWAISKWLG